MFTHDIFASAKRFRLSLCLMMFLVCQSAFFCLAAEPYRGLSVQPKAAENRWGNYWALIIGINNYSQWPQLRTAAKDAKELSNVLTRHYGFRKDRVILRLNEAATLSRINKDLRDISSTLGPNDNLLVYFAGHGQLDDLTGEGYWIPVDGQAKDTSSWLPNSLVKNILSSEQVKGKNIVVIADSCYSGSLLRGGPSLLSADDARYEARLQELALRKSRQVISSGGVEPVADGGRDGHSLFAYYLIKALRENRRQVIDIENILHSAVWKPVSEIGGQRPSLGRLKTAMDEDGQFVLVSAADQPPSEIPALPAVTSEQPVLDRDTTADMSRKTHLQVSSMTSQPGNLALNSNFSAVPSAFESDPGWGGGSYAWQILDGKRTYPGVWNRGLAFKGGPKSWAGQPCGWRQATVSFGKVVKFNRVVLWHHGLEHLPEQCNVEAISEGKWRQLFSSSSCKTLAPYAAASGKQWWQGWSTPMIIDFTETAASKVRFGFDNCGTEHGWLYEFEVYNVK